VQIAAPLIGFAAPKVGDRRIGAQRDGAAVRLDGGKVCSSRSAASPRPSSARKSRSCATA